MNRRQTPEFGSRRNSPRPPSPPSTDFSDNSVEPSHGASSNRRGGWMQNSEIRSPTEECKLDCVSLAEDLPRHGSHVSDVKSLSSGMKKFSLMPNSPLQADKSGEIKSCSPHLKKGITSYSAWLNPRDKPLEVWRAKSEQIACTKEGGCSILHCNTSSGADDIIENTSPASSANVKEVLHGKGSQDEKSSKKEMGLNGGSVTSHDLYDICPPKTGSVVVLKAPLHVKNREIRNENKRSLEGNIMILRPGMILLKGYISLSDQVELIRTCRELGMGPGGFYQPGYRDGAKLNLKMMCLGKNWDPEKGSYEDKRPSDGSKPPLIPYEFSQLVERAIKNAHAHLKEQHKKQNVEDILPAMSPNICIVNFYTKSGRLGLHQDKDESPQSLHKGLPVVSFSVGDSAEFLYGDERDLSLAEKVVLESGDVLIFGGKARHIYHGVPAIMPDTAPKSLLEETNLRPGRLNLTFREY